MSHYRISTKEEIVVDFIQWVSYHSDATCVASLPSLSSKGFTIL